MLSYWASFSRFHFLRSFTAQPVAISALLASIIGLAAGLIIVAEQAHGEGNMLRDSRALEQKLKQLPPASSQQTDLRSELPVFDSAGLVKILNHLAGEAKMALDEVSFSLDDNGNQPFLRYRATLTVSSPFPVIRRFLDQVRVEQPQLSLDSIVCTRDDITTTQPTCDLTLSAFYKKPAHG